jgi:hypothetical protein
MARAGSGGRGPTFRRRRLAFAVVTALLAQFVAVEVAAAAPTAPVLTSYPLGAVGAPDAAFSFVAGGASFYECRLDGGAWGVCTGGSSGTHVVAGLADGPHTLDVRAVDEVRTRGPSSPHTWTATAAPVVQWSTSRPVRSVPTT